MFPDPLRWIQVRLLHLSACAARAPPCQLLQHALLCRLHREGASYHVDAHVHVRPVFSGGVIICWRCPSESNGTIQDYCVSVMALRQSLKKAQEQVRNSKPLLHSACSEASICVRFILRRPWRLQHVHFRHLILLCCAHPVRTLVTAST